MPNSNPDSDMKRYIADALLEHLWRNPADKVKVTEFCAHAGISRSTFYLHFDSAYDVLQYIEDGLLADLEEMESRGMERHLVEGSEKDLDALRDIVSFLSSRLKIVRVLCGANRDAAFTARLTKRVHARVRALADKYWPLALPAQKDLVSAYVGGGSLATIKWWAMHPDEFTEEEVLRSMLLYGRSAIGLISGKAESK